VRKKELVSSLNRMRTAIDDAYALGVQQAKAYEVKNWMGGDWVTHGVLQELGISYMTLRWAYDAGYRDGVKERDAYEARRDEARGKRQLATGGPVRVTTWQIGENGPVSFAPNEDRTPTTKESEDE
jgi:hypothetical protein